MSIKAADFQTKPFELFAKRWALLSAGTLDHHNSMTISWGGMGTLWGKDVATVYVKPARFTYGFMMGNDRFVLSFFDKKYQGALSLMGSRSGRDIDKDVATGLHPVDHGGTIIYQEAERTFICKKIYEADLLQEHIPEQEWKTYYETQKPHRMFIGEIIEVL